MELVTLFIIIVGFMTAFIGSIAGIGGGTILIPSLLFLNHFFDSFSWVTPQKMVGISLAVMVFTGLSSTISYGKTKRIDYKSGLLFLIGSIPGGVLGSWLNQFINAKSFNLYFGAVMILVSSILFIKVKRDTSVPAKGSIMRQARSVELDGTTYHYSIPVLWAVLLSFGVGILSGLFGIGGGSLMVPAMMLLFGFPPHIATATSMFMILFVSIISSATHIALGHINWYYTMLFIPGAFIGGRVGAKVNQKMKSETVVWILRILLILIGVRLIWEGLS